MKRRNFLQATTMLPLFANGFFRRDLFAGDGIHFSNNIHRLPDTGKPDFFYRLPNAWVGDFIPSYDNGVFQLLYLVDWRDKQNHGECIPWYRVSTSDFVNFTDHGEIVPCGKPDE